MARLTQPRAGTQPNRIQVDGVGTVEVSNEFFQLSQEQQDQAIQEMVRDYGARPAEPTQDIQPSPGRQNYLPDWLHQAAPLSSGLRSAEELIHQGVGATQGAAGVLDNAAELLQGGYNQTLGRLFGQDYSATEANQGGGGFSGVTDRLPQGGGVGRTLGEIGASALLTRRLPGPFAQGAGTGALLSEAETPGQFAIDVLGGGAGGVIGERVIRGATSLAAPTVSSAARTLYDRGVRMTPGQVIPGLRRTEDRLTSRPFVGDQIVRGRQQSYEDFNRVALEDVVAPYNAVGQTPVRIPRTARGNAAVRSAGDQLSNRYERLVPNLTLLPDRQLADDITTIGTNLGDGDLTPAAVEQFQRIISNQVTPRLSGANPLTGESYRQIERSLGAQIRRYSASSNPDDQAMAAAFEEVQSAFQSALQRSNPRHAAELAALNESWANLVRVEGAAAGAKGGLFSPIQFRQAVRRADRSTRGRAMARGEARMQDLAEAAVDVLPPEYPDSGTAGRSQMSPFDPRYWLGAAQGLAYGPRVQNLITEAYMAPRHPAAQSIADLIRLLPAPQAGAAGASAVTAPLFGPVP